MLFLLIYNGHFRVNQSSHSTLIFSLPTFKVHDVMGITKFTMSVIMRFDFPPISLLKLHDSLRYHDHTSKMECCVGSFEAIRKSLKIVLCQKARE